MSHRPYACNGSSKSFSLVITIVGAAGASTTTTGAGATTTGGATYTGAGPLTSTSVTHPDKTAQNAITTTKRHLEYFKSFINPSSALYV
jgi:hypothetical protein